MKTTTEILAEIETCTEFQSIAGLSNRRSKAAHVLKANRIDVTGATLNACEWSADHGIVSDDFTATIAKSKVVGRLVRVALSGEERNLAKIENETVAANWSA